MAAGRMRDDGDEAAASRRSRWSRIWQDPRGRFLGSVWIVSSALFFAVYLFVLLFDDTDFFFAVARILNIGDPPVTLAFPGLGRQYRELMQHAQGPLANEYSFFWLCNLIVMAATLLYVCLGKLAFPEPKRRYGHVMLIQLIAGTAAFLLFYYLWLFHLDTAGYDEFKAVFKSDYVRWYYSQNYRGEFFFLRTTILLIAWMLILSLGICAIRAYFAQRSPASRGRQRLSVAARKHMTGAAKAFLAGRPKDQGPEK